MGFLDNTTNNIIVDAVLTDVGRQLLARNNGSFQIAKFSLGDSEIDYTRIQTHGRAVGIDNISILTPIFEAPTRASLTYSSRLITAADPSLVFLPIFTVGLANGDYVALNEGGNPSQVTATLEWQGSSTSIPVELQESTFEISLNNLFLQATTANGQILPVRYNSGNITTHLVSATQSATGASLSFKLAAKSLSATNFSTYKSSDGKIHTFVDIVGLNTGIKKQVEVIITET
jgi:hypothetical protein